MDQLEQIINADTAAVRMIGGNLALLEIAVYWLLSIGLFALMDSYAAKKLGGKHTAGYMSLRRRKFISMSAVSGVSVLAIGFFMRGIEVAATTMTFLGVPYLAVWLFYLVSVLRRLRAEREAKKAKKPVESEKKQVIRIKTGGQ